MIKKDGIKKLPKSGEHFTQSDFEFKLDQADPKDLDALEALAESSAAIEDRETTEFLRGFIMESRTTPHYSE